jgi:hypothetical protein
MRAHMDLSEDIDVEKQTIYAVGYRKVQVGYIDRIVMYYILRQQSDLKLIGGRFTYDIDKTSIVIQEVLMQT